jgi:hypothetical protein
MTQAGGGTETGSPGMRVATETCGQRIPLKFSTTVWEYWIRVDLRRRPAPPDAQRKRCSHRVGACSTIIERYGGHEAPLSSITPAPGKG